MTATVEPCSPDEFWSEDAPATTWGKIAKAQRDWTHMPYPTSEPALRDRVTALVDEWTNAADYGEDGLFGRVIARTLRSCASDLLVALQGGDR